MVATFDPDLTSATDRLRRLLGDADVSAALLQDDDYEAAVALYPDEAEAAAFVANGLAARFAQQPDSISDDGTSIRWGERVKTWLELAKRMQQQVVLTASALGPVMVEVTRADNLTPSEYARAASFYYDWSLP